VFPPPGVIGPGAPGLKGIVVAVDLGNSTTSAGYRDAQGQVVAIPDRDGLLCSPTVVGFDGGDPAKPVYGRTALNLGKVHDEWICTYAKLARAKEAVPAIVDKDGRVSTTAELEPLFLRWRLDYAEAFTGERIVGVLITVPANFDDAQRRASLDVVQRAGYTPIGVINEPTAALLRYAKGKDGTLAVIDAGGGTTDVTVTQVKQGTSFVIFATAGRDVGGKDFSARLLQDCLDYASRRGVPLDPVVDHRDITMLMYEVESAKCDLSSVERTTITFRAKGELIDLERTRAQFDELGVDVCQSIQSLAQEALAGAHLTPDDLTGVVLVGGASRTPCVRAAVESLFGRDKILTDIDVDKAVCLGAVEAIGLKLDELKAGGDTALVNRVHEYHFRSDLKLHEGCSVAMGVRAQDSRTGREVFVSIIAKNTPLPAEKRWVFGLLNGDKGVGDTLIVVLQGDPAAPLDEARILAQFSLRDLPAGPTEKRIEVVFAMDASGLVQVRAKDLFSGQEIAEQVDAREAVKKEHIV
jgi:molecular chaperone DnaK